MGKNKDVLSKESLSETHKLVSERYPVLERKAFQTTTTWPDSKPRGLSRMARPVTFARHNG